MARTTVVARFYEELNDFLPERQRKRDLEIEIDRARSVKDAIESVGIPHTEVDLILVDGRSVGFGHVLRGGERIAVYPVFEALDIYNLAPEGTAPVTRLRPLPLRNPRFVADGHLGKLARHMRMAGFDTLRSSAWDDDRIIQLATDEARTILTRDKGMLRRNEVDRGYFVRATESEAQLREVVGALQLERLLAPFTRCRECNEPLEDVERAAVIDRVPPKVLELYSRFKRCPGCERVYWDGSRFQRMKGVLDRLA